MSNSAELRQNIPDLRGRLNALIASAPTHEIPDRRRPIDSTGNRTQTRGYKGPEARLMAYARRRYNSVARVCVLLQFVRDSPGFGLPAPNVGHSGAVWQAFGGNAEFNACHSCPTLLTFDGLLPTVLTTNRGLQRLLIAEFGDCMLMPKSINGIDKLLDEQFGRDAFVEAAHHLLHTPSATWQDGLDVFDHQMADIYENARLILYGPRTQTSPRPPDQQALIDTLCAYFEGMQASRSDRRAIENFQAEVRREIGIA